MDKDIEILQDWIARDREMRNNSTESDYDKFCEEKCEAIEHIICENMNLYEKNNKLELALINTDRELREYKKAYGIAIFELDFYKNHSQTTNEETIKRIEQLYEMILKRAKEELNNGERKEK